MPTITNIKSFFRPSLRKLNRDRLLLVYLLVSVLFFIVPYKCLSGFLTG
jgi:hypothetical protein